MTKMSVCRFYNHLRQQINDQSGFNLEEPKIQIAGISIEYYKFFWLNNQKYILRTSVPRSFALYLVISELGQMVSCLTLLNSL